MLRCPLVSLEVLVLACAVVAGAAQPPTPQLSATPPTRDFASLVAQLTATRDDGAAESEALQEQALQMLDRAALEYLNSAKPDLAALNARLAMFVTHQPPVGEGYRVVRLGGEPATYALLADFGLGGPSAVRIYAGTSGHLALAARVDRYVQKDFLDDYIELVPLEAPAAVFVTVAGRTDELQTGVFTAWYFDGRTVAAVWSSDILQQSSYEAAADGFRLTYCAEAESADPDKCRAMHRDRYVWQDRAWRRAETTALPPAVPAR